MGARRSAALAGAMAVAVALALAELVARVADGVPSLVTSVGSLVVPRTPAWLEDWAIATFGTDDKAVLAAGVVLVTLLVGAVAGVLGLQGRWRPAVLVVGFTTVGLLAALQQPVVSTGPTTLVAIGAGATSWVVLVAAWRLLAPSSTDEVVVPQVGDPRRPAVARRQFLGLMGGTGVVAAGATIGARALRADAPRGAVVDPVVLPDPRRALPPPSPAASFDLEGLTPIHVPNGTFYRIDTALSVPRIDRERWELRVHGMVDRELRLGYQDLLDRSHVEQDATIACVSNEVGGDLVGTARWLGTSLADLLAEAGVQDDATQVVGRAVDGWTAGFPTSVLDDREALVVVGMNGVPLPPDHGFPARLIVPGLYGYVSATKWLTEIELTTWEAFDAYWVPRGWAKEGPIKTQSRIDVPSPGARVDAGPVVVAGVAWAPTRGVERVEVRIDEEPWSTAELTDPLSPAAWVQWRTTVDVPPGAHRVQVRATDGDGVTQGAQQVPPRPDGAEGWHTITVRG